MGSLPSSDRTSNRRLPEAVGPSRPGPAVSCAVGAAALPPVSDSVLLNLYCTAPGFSARYLDRSSHANAI